MLYYHRGEKMNQKQDLRIKKTYKLLCDALFTLLETKNFNEIKLTEICELAMVHKTTFYHHFEDKYELLKYAITELQKNISSQIENTSSDDLIAYYCNIAYIYMKHIKQHQKLYRSILLHDYDRICSDIFYDLFVKDLENKLHKVEVEIPIHYVTNFYVSAVFSTLNEWVTTGLKESEDQMINYLKMLLCAPKPK